MDVTAETIEAYFAQYGWAYERLDDAHFVTGFDSDVAEASSVYVTLAPNWVYFAISPFVEAPTDAACESRLHRHLLRLCQEINLAKFSVNAQGDVILTVELSRAGLDYSEFADALDALSYYADEHYLTVQALATDRGAISSFSGEEDLDWGE